MRALQQRLGTSIILITHNLGVVAEAADDVAVMYAGKIVESGPVEQVFADAQHPYTLGLIASLPRLDEDVERLQTIPGTVPHPSQWQTGCRFSPRCALATDTCRTEAPPLIEISSRHVVACWHAPIERCAQ
jgi:peptide/nickel transport system ATP-binding protein